jgi:hypothetical protein
MFISTKMRESDDSDLRSIRSTEQDLRDLKKARQESMVNKRKGKREREGQERQDREQRNQLSITETDSIRQNTKKNKASKQASRSRELEIKGGRVLIRVQDVQDISAMVLRGNSLRLQALKERGGSHVGQMMLQRVMLAKGVLLPLQDIESQSIMIQFDWRDSQSWSSAMLR